MLSFRCVGGDSSSDIRKCLKNKLEIDIKRSSHRWALEREIDPVYWSAMKTKILLVLLALAPLSSEASNYPPDYCRQRVYTTSEGPLLVGYVASGCGSSAVIGYKKSGVLAKSLDSPVALSAVITGKCTLIASTDKNKLGDELIYKSTIQLGREYHGTGYMSAPISLYDFAPSPCLYQGRGSVKIVLNVAFSDNQGNWDSKYGVDYQVNLRELGAGQSYLSQDDGLGIGLDSWNFIIQKMSE